MVVFVGDYRRAFVNVGAQPAQVVPVMMGIDDEADRLAITVSNLSLQKLLYFAHGLSLIEDGKPLVSGYFEAWQHGPVHPLVYHTFKDAGRSPISFRGKGVDILTGKSRPLPVIDDPQALRFVLKVLIGYGRLSAGALIDVTHAKGGPWDFIVKRSEHSIVLGMRIPDDVISERFKNHVRSLNATTPTDGPHEILPCGGTRTGAERALGS